MPTKTTVTVQSPSRASTAKSSPRVTVNTGAARTTKAPAPQPSKSSKTATKSSSPKPQPSTATAVTEDRRSRPSNLIAVAGIVGALFLCFILFFAWKGLTGVSSEAIATRLEKAAAAEQEKNRSAEKERVEILRDGFVSLESKVDNVVKDNKAAVSKFADKTEELERGMVRLVDGVKEIRGQVASDLASFRKEVLRETEEQRRQSNEKIESIAAKIESRLKDPEPPPPPLPLPPKPVTQEGTRSVAASSTKHFLFEGEELRPGEMSKKYCIDDIRAGKIEISSKSGIIARNHLHTWRSGWIDTPVPSTGTYVASPDAKYVSFYSLSDTFTVKRIKM